jgi:hypothetical protein
MIDMVPKAISLTLVSFAKENLQRELLQELYKAEVLEDLLKESEYVVSRRKEAISMVQALNKAEEWVFIVSFPVWLALNCFVHQDCCGRLRMGLFPGSRWTVTLVLFLYASRGLRI